MSFGPYRNECYRAKHAAGVLGPRAATADVDFATAKSFKCRNEEPWRATPVCRGPVASSARGRHAMRVNEFRFSEKPMKTSIQILSGAAVILTVATGVSVAKQLTVNMNRVSDCADAGKMRTVTSSQRLQA